MRSFSFRFAGVTLTFALAVVSFGQNFIIGANFGGTKISDLPAINGGYEFIPPDTQGAIGPNHFVETLNDSFAIYNRSGSLVQPRKSMDQFFSDAGVAGLNANTPILSDPHILWDSNSQRWFATMITANVNTGNKILVATSTTSDPTGAWKGWVYNTDANHFADYDTIGLNKDALYVATNNFGTANRVGLLAVRKSDLVAGAASPTAISNQLLLPSTYGYTLQPVVDLNNGTGSENILSSGTSFASTTAIKLDNLSHTDTFAGSALTNVATTSLGGTFNAPPDATQKGSANLIATNDVRFDGNSIQLGNKIWQVFDFNSGGRAAAEIVETDTSGNIISKALVNDPSLNLYFPSVAVNEFGDIAIGFTGSDSANYASSYVMRGHYDIGTGAITMSNSVQLVQAGGGSYYVTFGGAENRWGDYSAIMLDPNDHHKFWTIQEWAPTTNVWQTQITELGTQAVPEPASMAALAIGIGAFISKRRKKA